MSTLPARHVASASVNIEIEISVVEVALHSFENEGKDQEADHRD
jgi:hypothetical protein